MIRGAQWQIHRGATSGAPRRSLPSDQLNMARSMLRPRLLDAGLINAAWFNMGYADRLAGLKWRLTPDDLLYPERTTENLSYMLGYRAGELERGGGAQNAIELAGRREGA